MTFPQGNIEGIMRLGIPDNDLCSGGVAEHGRLFPSPEMPQHTEGRIHSTNGESNFMQKKRFLFSIFCITLLLAVGAISSIKVLNKPPVHAVAADSIVTTDSASIGSTQGSYPGKGLNFGQLFDNNGNSNLNEAQMQQIEKTGAKWLRLDFFTNPFIKKSNGQVVHDRYGNTVLDIKAFFAAYDPLVTALTSKHHIQLIGLLGPGFVADSNQKQWTTNNIEHAATECPPYVPDCLAETKGDNPFIEAFAAQAGQVVDHFKNSIHYWEAWNEANAYDSRQGLDQGGTFLYPSNFAALLSRVYMRLRPDHILLISGGLLAFNIGKTRYSGADYLAQTYQMGINKEDWTNIKARINQYPLDAVGQHIYILQGSQITPADMKLYLQELRAVYTNPKYQDGRPRDTIVTEVGWSTQKDAQDEGAVSLKVQAMNLRSAFNAAKDPSNHVAMMLWFRYQDQPGFTSKGIVDKNGHPKQPTWLFFRFV